MCQSNADISRSLVSRRTLLSRARRSCGSCQMLLRRLGLGEIRTRVMLLRHNGIGPCTSSTNLIMSRSREPAVEEETRKKKVDRARGARLSIRRSSGSAAMPRSLIVTVVLGRGATVTLCCRSLTARYDSLHLNCLQPLATEIKGQHQTCET